MKRKPKLVQDFHREAEERLNAIEDAAQTPRVESTGTLRAAQGDGHSCGLASKYQTALNLLERASSRFEHMPPDENWFKEYYLLTGEHAVLTDEGWQPGETKHLLDANEIRDEVNAPDTSSGEAPTIGELLSGLRLNDLLKGVTVGDVKRAFSSTRRPRKARNPNRNSGLGAPLEGNDGNAMQRLIRREGRCSNCGGRQFVGYCDDCATCGAWLKGGNAKLLPLTEEQLLEKASAEGVTLKELKRLCPEQFQ